SFKTAALDEAEADARLLLGHALRLDRTRLVAQADRILEAREVDAISALAARRLKREPVARILGRKEFWSVMLNIGPAVLVPRPDTETLVETALDALARGGLRMKKLRILDIGTGSGAILLALLSEMPNAIGYGTDISFAALTIARENAHSSALAARCHFLVCDHAAAIAGPFDLIMSNPPYVARGEIAALSPEVRDYDPTPALDGGDDGLDAYRAIAADVPRLLAKGGQLIVELGAGQEDAVRTLFTKAGLIVGTARKDLAGVARALPARVEA
ncbi:MAG: peptide chain release factor N(5)-glutamine methyltransferase, partial [bacterium]